jgi:hypothetical protein
MCGHFARIQACDTSSEGEPYARLDGQPAWCDAAILRERVDQLADEVI